MQTCSPELYSETVKDAASQVLAAHADVSESALRQSRFTDLLATVFAVSPYFMQTCQRYEQQVRALLDSGALLPAATAPSLEQHQAWMNANLESALAQLDSGIPSDDQRLSYQLVAIRQFRHVEMLRILWRDFAGFATVDQTLLALSNMADACIQVASAWAHATVSQRYGESLDDQGQAQSMIILGMGKLGGRELNVSSDIDLIYVYPRAGNSNGATSIDNEAYFRRVAQLVTKLLGNVTADGFAFRVDTRLRPFGESGPLVMNFNGLEQYYLTQGRDWERYAMVKARPITGSLPDLESLASLLTPFVYRRYLDYSAIDSLRDLKRKISLSVKQKGLRNNVKLGLGGIREVEFIGQAFQLVRGGRQERLRERSIKPVLQSLEDMKLMDSADVKALCVAYDFLRRTENAVQSMRDQQVHSLPDDPLDQLRLIAMLDFKQWADFEGTLQKHRDVVAERFNALFSDWDTDNSEQVVVPSTDAVDDNASIAWAVLSSPEVPEGAAEEAVRSLGMEPDDELMEGLASLTRGGFYQRLTSRAQERVDRILPLLISACMRESNPSISLLRCLTLVRAIAGRSGYLQILIERPPALHRLVTLFARSDWVATFVSRHPIVIDELLRDNSNARLPDLQQLTDEALHEAGRLSELELDEQMDAMRQFQQARALRIAVAELTEDLPLMRVSDQLTWLAEAVIHAVVRLVEQKMIERYGQPSCIIDGQIHKPEFGVVAYGKLGGIELSYGSDLDLVFLHDSRGTAQQTNGPKQVDNSFYYARLAQKVVHFMTTHTPGGILYEIDLRLRPNGQSGVLVTGFDAYDHYQQNKAWTWEHQALVRTRMIYGSAVVANRFSQIRDKILAQNRAAAALREEVINMRHRMRENLPTGSKGYLHLKNDEGGVADIEFMVQYIVLAHAANYPELLKFPDNVRILQQATLIGLISQQQCDLLTQSYLSLRRVMHRQSLQQKPPIVALSASVSQIQSEVMSVWSELMTTQHQS